MVSIKKIQENSEYSDLNILNIVETCWLSWANVINNFHVKLLQIVTNCIIMAKLKLGFWQIFTVNQKKKQINIPFRMFVI